jgi:single-strand DNA-binding protein
MNNQIILLGRLTKNLKIKEKNDKKYVDITLSIPRSFKNSDGIYETDFISCTAFDKVAEATAENCQKGDLIAIKGRLENTNGNMRIVVEKLTFLKSYRPKESESNE